MAANDKENAVELTSFEKQPLESILAPKVSDVVLGEAKANRATDELADLAFLGITGATPGGRKWRSRMKEANQGVEIKPMAMVEEAVEVA